MSNFIISNVDYCGDPRNRSMLSVTKVDNIIIIGCCMLSENIDAAYGWCRSSQHRCSVVLSSVVPKKLLGGTVLMYDII